MALDNNTIVKYTDKTTLKNWFKRLDKPKQGQFWEWFDSYWHKSESLPISSISGLGNLLDGKAETEHTHTEYATNDATSLDPKNVASWKKKLGIADLKFDDQAITITQDYADFGLVAGDSINAFNNAIYSEVAKKLDAPTENATNEYVLLADGSTALKGDLGKNFANTDLVVSSNRKHIGTASVEFAMPFICSNPSIRYSALVSKHNDATYNRLLGMDSQGNLNEVGIYALTNEMSKATDAQKDLWRNASRKSNETTGATVPSITAVNAITLGNNAGFNYPFSVLGVNLNLVQHVNLIKVKDEQGQLIPEELVSITNFTRDSVTRITIEYPTNTFTNGFIVVEFVDSLYYSVRSEEIEVSDVIKSLTPPVVNWSYIGSTNRIQTNDVIEGNKITLLHNSTDSNQFTNRCNYETNPFITRDMVTQGFEITFKTNFVFKNANRIIDGYPPIGIYLKTSDNIDFLTLNQDDIERMRYDSAFYKINTIQTTIYRGGTFENSIQNYLQQSYITIKYKNGLINIIIYYEDGTIKNFKRSLYVPPSSSIVSGGLKVAIDIGGNFTPFQEATLDRSIEIIDFKIK